MDNPQERLLPWFAGIIDGEGSVSFQTCILKGNTLRVSPFIIITNSDIGIITGCTTVVNRLLGQKRYSVYKRDGVNKPVYDLRVNCKSALIVANAAYPYMMSEKRRNVEALNMFYESRNRRLLVRDSLGRLRRQGYTFSEIEMICSVRTHKSAKSSETLRQASNVVDDDKVRSLFERQRA